MEDTEAQLRLRLVQDILAQHHLSAKSIDPLPRAKSNHVYKVSLSSPVSPRLSRQPDVSRIPASLTTLCVRISAAAAALEDAVRVSNEVAFLKLARKALEQSGALSEEIVPRVFAWEEGSPSGPGWIVMEWKAGVPFDHDAVKGMGRDGRAKVAEQVALLVKAFQTFRLPDGVDRFGGVGFDEHGKMVNSRMSLQYGGPFTSFRELMRAALTWHIEASKRTTDLKGWKDEGDLMERLERFLLEGFDKVFDQIPEDKCRPVLVHGDLGESSRCSKNRRDKTNSDTSDGSNMLFDPSTFTLTGIVDFDLAHIGIPLSDYLLADLGFRYMLAGSVDWSDSGTPYQEILHGFDSNTNDGLPTAFPRAKILDDALARVGADRPATFEGSVQLADLWWMAQDICQAFWFIPRLMDSWGPKRKAMMKTRSANNVRKYLDQWGY
ncbi:hypothetical protein ANO11243_063700 [Dothideomycetidae sp. 11243]|nr:hypothetical protein ANO11243_063700 [fungal sp. No.11243]